MTYTKLRRRPLPDTANIVIRAMLTTLYRFLFLFQPLFSEFCGEENHGIELSPDAVPSDSVADYLLEPAEPEPSEDGEKESTGPDNEKEGKKTGGIKGPSKKSNLVIFAVDISGSMSTTVEVPALQAEWSSVTGRGGGGGGARYISRLEAIKEAVCRHLDHMSVTEPHNKVSVIQNACLNIFFYPAFLTCVNASSFCLVCAEYL